MTSQNSQSPPMTRNERRGSLSSFESLLRLDDTKGPSEARQPGTGAAILYLRVSTQRQMTTAIDLDPDGNSIATQREATLKRAKRLKAPILKEFVEPGHSAQSIAKRPVFRELLQFVEDNPDVDYVIIYMRSRIFRNQTDAAITKRILDSMGVRLISAKEEFGEGYMADAMEAITDIMNEVQVRQSGEDISNKMLHKAKNGGTVGRAKIGYLNVRKDVDGHLVNSIDIDPKRAPLITWAFEQYATGDYSLMRLRQELEDQGLTTRRTAKWEEKGLSRSQLAVLLRDPYYLGMLPYKGQVYSGKHPALVTPEVFERVQQVLDDRKRRTQRDRIHSHMLRGMLLCGRCHAEGRRFQMVYTKVDGRNGVTNEYYHCIGRQQGKCDLPYLPVSLVEAAVLREVKSLRLTETEAAVMREQVEAQLEVQLKSERAARVRINKEMDSLGVKEERLLDLAADGSLSTEKVKERLSKLQIQRLSLLKRLQTTEDVIRQEGSVMLQYIELLGKPSEFYVAADGMVKRKLLNAFFTHIWIDDDKHRVIPEAQPQPIVEHIQQQARKKPLENKGTGRWLGAFEPSYSLGIYSNKTNLVGSVDEQSSNRRLLPPTPDQLEKLAKASRDLPTGIKPTKRKESPTRSLQRRLSPADIEMLANRYEAGETVSSLSREFEISRPALRNLLRGEGVSPRRRGLTSEDADKAIELYQSGLTINQVIEHVGYSYGVVNRMLHKRGVAVRPRRHQE